jgi:hypothetical protein
MVCFNQSSRNLEGDHASKTLLLLFLPPDGWDELSGPGRRHAGPQDASQEILQSFSRFVHEAAFAAKVF